MSSHAKALDKAKKHTHKKGEDGKCTICDLVIGNEGKVDDKGKKPGKEFGAKNNDSQED
jgi:hypothetical protein